jgi:hypothetical protein
MTKKEQSELSQLNSKFDILIGLMTKQLQNKVEITKEPSLPLADPRSDVILKTEQILVKGKIVLPPKKQVMVSLYIDPKFLAQINGHPYEGHVTVPEDVAVELRRIMFESKRISERSQISFTHTTRNHVVPGGI